jgi:hypothetical protein
VLSVKRVNLRHNCLWMGKKSRVTQDIGKLGVRIYHLNYMGSGQLQESVVKEVILDP